VVRFQSDRVGRRPPGSRYEDRTFGRDADERESTAQRFLAQEMASATVSLGGTGPAMIGPGRAGPLSSGGGEGWRPSDTLLRRVQDRPRTVFA